MDDEGQRRFPVAGRAFFDSVGIREVVPRDGHFVIYDIPEAMQATAFVRHMMDEPNGRVPAR